MRTGLRNLALAGSLAYMSGHGAIMQSGSVDPSSSGSSVYPAASWSSVLKTRAMENSFYSPSGTSGTVLHNVNMLTGQPVYSVPIAEISSGGVARFPISLTYAGSIRGIFDADNEKGPTSWIGYGWNFTTPFVAVNHKGTVSISDDVYFCNLGPYGGGQLLQNSAGKFFVATDPSIQVLQPIAGANGLITQWTFQWPGGLRMIFGSGVTTDPASRTLNMVGSTLTGSPYSAAASSDFTYRWDVARMDDYRTGDATGSNSIDFFYDRKSVAIGSNRSYVREAYVKHIICKNRGGDEIERYSFVLAPKTAAEYRSSEFEPGIDQSLYETQGLLRIEHYVEGSAAVDRQYELNSTLQQAFHPTIPYPKRFLTSLQVSYRNPLGVMIQDPNKRWFFWYNGPHGALKAVDRPFLGRDEFEYGGPDYSSPAWSSLIQQEPSISELKNESGQVISTGSGNWENQSFCTENFCFVAAKENSSSDLLHFTVWRNSGTYFKKAQTLDAQGAATDLVKTVSSTYINSLQIIPWNDNFIILDSRGKKLWLYEWDGQYFTMKTDFIKREYPTTALTTITPNVTSGAAPTWSVVLGSDYFMVVDRYYKNPCSNTVAFESSKVYVIRKSADGGWKDMNERECSDPTTCVRTSPPTGNGLLAGCMEFNTLELSVNAGPGLLQVVHGGVSALFTWAQAPSGNSFNFISKIATYGKAVQPILYGKDYFLLNARTPGSDAGEVGVYQFDGQAVRKITQYQATLYPNSMQDQQLRVYASADYFILIDRTHPYNYSTFPFLLWKKVVTRDANQIPTGFSFASHQVAYATLSDYDVRVRTHPSGFSVEAYPLGSLQDGQVTKPPVADPSGTNYLTWLFEVDPGLSPTPFRDVTSSFKDALNHNLYDVNFSSFDNLIIGTSCKPSSGTGRCIDYTAGSFKIQFATALLTPGLGAAGKPFIRHQMDVFSPWPATPTYAFTQYRISNASPICAISMVNTATLKVEYALLQSMGTGFTRFPYEISGSAPQSGDLTYVKSFKSLSGLTGNGWGHWTEYGFRYGSDNLGLVNGSAEYNSPLRSFLFPVSSVVSYRGSESAATPVSYAAETVHHVIDAIATPLDDASIIQQGLVAKSRVHDANGPKGAETLGREIKRTDYAYYPPTGNSAWPLKLLVTRPKSITTTQWARNLSHHTEAVSFHSFNPYNNQPLFRKRKAGNDWYLTQTLYQNSGVNQGVPFGETTYRYAAEPSDASLAAWTAVDQPFPVNNTTEKTVAASESEFDANYPYMVKKKKVWRDTDPSLTDAALKTGTDPVHIRNEGWEDRLIIDKWNKFGQPLETRTLIGASIERKTAYFYEGRASMPVGQVVNSFAEDAAILTAENGNVNLPAGFHDWEGRWSRADAGYSPDIAHTGRWSIKVVDNYGPTALLRLKGVVGQGYDYIVSAWVYCENAIKPVITAKVYSASGTPSSTSLTVQDPVGEAFTAKKWQRYEIRLTNAQLRASQNLFTTETSNDYLKVQVGTGAPGTGSTRIAYVDDIVCRSSKSVVSLSAYDANGQATHSTNNDHLTFTSEYDLFGNLSAAKDDEKRTFNANAAHQPGEND